MKVLAVLYTDDEIHVLRPEIEQFIAMHKKGIELHIVTTANTQYAQRLESLGIKVIDGYPDTKKDSAFTVQLRSILRSGNYDIIHVLERRAIACAIKAVKGIDTKLVVYRGASGLYWHDPTAYKNALHPRVDKVICVCNDIRDNIRKQLFFKEDKAVTIYKGHSLSWYENVIAADRPEFGVTDEVVILCPAHDRKWKGIPTFLEAIHLLPSHLKVQVLLVGRGMEKPFYQKLVKSNNNKEKIQILGFRKDVLNLAKMSDIIMQTSYKNEGLSRSTIEGISLGCVPVVTNAGGNAELVVDQQTGIVVPIKDAQTMANAIVELYNNKERMKAMTEAAYLRIQEYFTVEKTASETIAVYEGLMI